MVVVACILSLNLDQAGQAEPLLDLGLTPAPRETKVTSHTLRFLSDHPHQEYRGSHTLICPEVRLFHVK